MVNISNLLTDLDLKKVNDGTSSGSIWLKSKGDSRTIYSPVDGNPIADVIETDDVSYKSILKMQKNHLCTGGKFLHLKGVR